MGQVESAEQAPNTVVTEFQKGYLLHNRLLRPSLVIVAKAPSNATVNSMQPIRLPLRNNLTDDQQPVRSIKTNDPNL